MAENTNLKLTAVAWADITIDRWLKKIKALGIGNTKSEGALAENFYQHVMVDADGNPDRIVFTMEYYAMMINAGVGKGVPLNQRDGLIAMGKTTRRAKPFYSDVFYKEIFKLHAILAEKYGILAVNMIIEKTEGTLNI